MFKMYENPKKCNSEIGPSSPFIMAHHLYEDDSDSTDSTDSLFDDNEQRVGSLGKLYLFLVVILFPIFKLVLAIYIIFTDIKEDEECLKLVGGCNRTMYDSDRAVAFLESLTFSALSSGNLLVGIFIFINLPTIKVHMLESKMKFYGVIYVVEIISIGIGFLTITITANVITLAALVVILEGIAVNMSFFYPKKYDFYPHNPFEYLVSLERAHDNYDMPLYPMSLGGMYRF